MLERYDTDILVIGAGPAGLAAAVCAAESGRRIIVLDDNLGAGGNIWRGETQQPKSPGAAQWFARVRQAQLTIHQGTRVFQQPEPQCLLAETAAGVREYRYRKLILATGARERFLPFPGWTLPNVMGAGGLQALVKSGLPIAGKRVVIAGSGPLLLAVAASLKQKGAKILLIAEQASRADFNLFRNAALRSPSKLLQGIKIKAQLLGVPYRTSCHPVEASGDERLQHVRLSQGKMALSYDCDYLACGFHLVPNVELADLLGCEMKTSVFTEKGNLQSSRCVWTDELQQTSVQNVYAAGELTGIGGVELSLIEGQIAGYAVAEKTESARQLFTARIKQQQFAEILNRAFAQGHIWTSHSLTNTVICRCEDVTFDRLCREGGWQYQETMLEKLKEPKFAEARHRILSEIRSFEEASQKIDYLKAELGLNDVDAPYGEAWQQPDWRSAKLHTRCGMGACQGRVCGAALEVLLGWGMSSVRPPAFPVRLSSLMTSVVAEESAKVD